MPDPVAQVNEPRRLDAFLVSYSDAEPATCAARRRSAGQRVRRRELEGRAANARRDGQLPVKPVEAAASSGWPRSRPSCAPSKESYHGPAARADSGQPVDAVRPAPADGGECHRAARRTGSALDDRAPARRGAPGERATWCSCLARTAPLRRRPRRVASSRLQRELAEARAMYTDKHPEVQRLEEELADARGRMHRPSAPSRCRTARRNSRWTRHSAS